MIELSPEVYKKTLESLRERGLDTDNPLECWTWLRLTSAKMQGIESYLASRFYETDPQFQGSLFFAYRVMLQDTLALKDRICTLRWNEICADEELSFEGREDRFSQLRQKLDILGDLPTQEIRIAYDSEPLRIESGELPLKVITRSREDYDPDWPKKPTHKFKKRSS
jgi:hypothetical protein